MRHLDTESRSPAAWPRYGGGADGVLEQGIRPRGVVDAVVVAVQLERKGNPLDPPKEGGADSHHGIGDISP